MRRFLVSITIAAIGTTVVGAGIVLAAELEVTPQVPEQGESELTLEVEGFEPNAPIYAIPCDVPVDGPDVDVTTDNCDIAKVVTATTDDEGKATITVRWDIPAAGIAVYVGDEARSHEVTQILSPAPVEEPTDGSEVVVLGTNIVQEDLADTGARETVLLLIVATAAIGLGFALQKPQRLLPLRRES